MRKPIAFVLCVLCLAAHSLSATDDRIEIAIRELSSPYLEARERAVRTLSTGGPEASAAMKAAYPAADFRTRALILTAFAGGDPAAGMDLLFLDLDSEDRGVLTAQRALVNAIYERASEFATRRIVPLLPPGDWEWEEGIRALPCRAPSARKGLATLLSSQDLDYRGLGRILANRVAAVDRLRERLSEARGASSPAVAATVRELSRLLIRRDVERAFFAVWRAGGGDGTYDGLYLVVKEVLEAEGPVALSVLFWILDDTAPPEQGVPPAKSSPYPFLEAVPLDMTTGGVRRRAAFCIGDVGTKEVAPRLAERYETYEKEVLDPFASPRQDVAHACAALGEEGPLREIVAEYLDMRLGSDGHSRLAACYARLGDLESAIAHFQQANSGFTREWLYHYNMACVLSRLGRVKEALKSLVMANEAGYGRDPSNLRWMERDGDLANVRKLPGYALLLKKLKAEFR